MIDECDECIKQSSEETNDIDMICCYNFKAMTILIQ